MTTNEEKDRRGVQKKEPAGTLSRVSLDTQHSLRASEDPVGATQQSYAKRYDVIEDENSTETSPLSSLLMATV